MTQLRWSADLLNATCPDRLFPELHSALGDLAAVAGYLAVDANAHEQAQRVHHFALACAEEAGNWPLRAEILASRAHQAIRTGQPDEGLTLVEHGLVRSDRLTAAGLSALHTARGRALATMRRIEDALTAIGTADDHFAHFTPDNEPPCMSFYNPARNALHAGLPLIDLAILGRDPGSYPQSTQRRRLSSPLVGAALLSVCTGRAHPRSAHKPGRWVRAVCSYLAVWLSGDSPRVAGPVRSGVV